MQRTRIGETPRMGHGVMVRLQPPLWVEGEIVLTRPPRDIYEVLCRDCGDNFGPYDMQPALIRDLRGPYIGREAAERAAQAHRVAASPIQLRVRRVKMPAWMRLARNP